MKLTKYGPKGNLSPSIGDACKLCGLALMPGDYTTLIAPSEQTRYANAAVEVHWDCATKSSSAAAEPR